MYIGQPLGGHIDYMAENTHTHTHKYMYSFFIAHGSLIDNRKTKFNLNLQKFENQ